MSPQTSNEPSLEEILSSIRRIISEDGPTTAQAAMNVTDSWPMTAVFEDADEADEDVLVLTERVPMNGQPFLHAEAPALHAKAPVLHAEAPVLQGEAPVLQGEAPVPQITHPALPPEAPAEVSAEILPSWETVESAPVEAEPVVEAQAAPPMEAPVMARPHEKPVVAEDTEVEAAAAFGKLDAVTHASETSARSLLMPAPGRTLEDVIRELMQPMLKEWLDENLPAIVQARVDEEIERISKRRVR